MRNSVPTWMSMVFLTCLTGGCAAEDKSQPTLADGYRALEAQQYDAAMAAADAQLERSSRGRGSAEALYLKGRAFEQRTAANPHDARANLQSARNAYLEALSRDPAPKLESFIRTSLANVLYFQDDYTAAAREWNAAYKRLDDPAVKSWVLYRIGLCQQRLGQFEAADKTFAEVQQHYPNTIPAQRAREHQGARGFTVQLATYANRATAESAMNLLRREGVMPAPATDAQGRTIVRVGPVPSYQQALSLKQRYASRYPDALILP